MCSNKECKLSETCYRFTATANKYAQSYLGDPKKDCEEVDYEYYVKESK